MEKGILLPIFSLPSKYGVGDFVPFIPIFPNRSLVEVHIELRNVRDALSELQRAVALLGQRRSEHHPEAEAVIVLDAIYTASEPHLVDDTIFLRSFTDVPEQISAIFLIHPFRILVGPDILSYIHDPIRRHLQLLLIIEEMPASHNGSVRASVPVLDVPIPRFLLRVSQEIRHIALLHQVRRVFDNQTSILRITLNMIERMRRRAPGIAQRINHPQEQRAE